MIEIKGKYNLAKVYTDTADSATLDQVRDFVNKRYLKGQKICIMPDCHAGRNICVGFTSTFNDKIDPATIGCDIGCGMQVTELGNIDIDFEKLDQIVNSYIPGKNLIENNKYSLRKISPKINEKLHSELLSLKANVEVDRELLNLGSLGGGNHFISIEADEDNNKYLIVHTGSRHLGIEIEKYYSNLARNTGNKLRKNLIDKLKVEHKEKEIQNELFKLSEVTNENFIMDEDLENYLHDMKITQHYAEINRAVISFIICEEMGWLLKKSWSTIHNYIDLENKIIRKGAVSCKKDERVIIPMNMRDGSLICIGKGNPDTNFSGPHGVGRLCSRSKAKEALSMEEYKNSMKGIWTSSVSEDTLDEAPMAYKPMDEIIKNIEPMATVEKILKPLYNYKSN